MNCRSGWDAIKKEKVEAEVADLGSYAESAIPSRPETITVGLVLLLNAYRCCACRYLANCIVSHCRTLKNHPDADPVLRQLAAHLEIEWHVLALPAPSAVTRRSTRCV